ncbi:MAG TPA: hypothetical protein EYP36_06035 [Calditrichaeota bacterium]|nr:hypothetical protein [Calditrichota bacterium]
MKKTINSIFLIILLTLPLTWYGCAGPAHVTVGVGVAVPGPWIGPYPGGGVWVGRPFPGHYYPLKNSYRQFVQQNDTKKTASHSTNGVAAIAPNMAQQLQD